MENKSEEEIKNDNVIPVELKEQLSNKVKAVLENISMIENSISKAIDDSIERSDKPITTTEINASLLNVLRKMNQREIMEVIK